MLQNEKYLIFGKQEDAFAFIEKVKAQDLHWSLEYGFHVSLGPWYKVRYEGAYKPF